MSGYIALAGKKVHDDDTVYMAQLVASDPHDAASFPDICLDQAVRFYHARIIVFKSMVCLQYCVLVCRAGVTSEDARTCASNILPNDEPARGLLLDHQVWYAVCQQSLYVTAALLLL